MTELLANRLDNLMIRLDQESRSDDAQLVREVIAIITKPAIVGSPWTTPLEGDVCTRTDGKSREAVWVEYRRSWGLPARGPESVHEPTDGYSINLVCYRDQKGREDTISASSWNMWCRAACRAGGTYTRAKETTT